ncbi:MAG: rhodanese-like domain-containing protein [Bacteroidota bacterium]
MVIFIIIVISSLAGLSYNFFNSHGIPLVKSPEVTQWADDSLLTLPAAPSAYQSAPGSDTLKNSEDQLNKKESPSLPQKPIVKDSSSHTVIFHPKSVTLSQALRLHKSGSAVFIDARDKWEFSDGHITGAVNIAEYSFDKNNVKLKTIPKTALVITYCGEGDCSMSQKLAEKLTELGYKRVFVFQKGYESWLNAGYPTENTELE